MKRRPSLPTTLLVTLTLILSVLNLPSVAPADPVFSAQPRRGVSGLVSAEDLTTTPTPPRPLR